MRFAFAVLAVMMVALTSRNAGAESSFHQVVVAPSTDAEQLQIGVTHTLWIPPGTQTLRGVIVHQHGCGVGACRGGKTAAYDLHWQSLAKKWDCGALGSFRTIRRRIRIADSGAIPGRVLEKCLFRHLLTWRSSPITQNSRKYPGVFGATRVAAIGPV